MWPTGFQLLLKECAFTGLLYFFEVLIALFVVLSKGNAVPELQVVIEIEGSVLLLGNVVLELA